MDVQPNIIGYWLAYPSSNLSAIHANQKCWVIEVQFQTLPKLTCFVNWSILMVRIALPETKLQLFG